ncbi:Prolyl 4-hydroxylase subunit alpha-1 [Tetrabaena socialis]|uniref:Prolyl 4-hydroxylase subunit alpha-1 n=1 Tax=Tetrabaena socialis TaxID=47790 RepID=A0A2J7ZHU4_9CHLO|nr:Prolyl 4-hydroxylase subunit alpha-1 [Tetrabaena socialis]|eukprot:PNG99841.1 Prolyl 4-hydroxylase subunit alpha-1 [Tetrabaena socialis]
MHLRRLGRPEGVSRYPACFNASTAGPCGCRGPGALPPPHAHTVTLLACAPRSLLVSYPGTSNGGSLRLPRLKRRHAAGTRRAPHARVPRAAPQVLRYVNGQKYDAHWDWFDEKEINGSSSGNRMATVLMYLSDVDPAAGGETALPLAMPLDDAAQSVEGRGFSTCAARMGISVRPKKGDVLLFWDMDPGGSIPDRHALHASCPTFAGTKWTATKWIHNNKYG